MLIEPQRAAYKERCALRRGESLDTTQPGGYRLYMFEMRSAARQPLTTKRRYKMKHNSIHYAIIEDNKRLFNTLLAANPALMSQLDARGQAPHEVAIEQDAGYYLERLMSRGLAKHEAAQEILFNCLDMEAYSCLLRVLHYTRDIDKRSIARGDTLFFRLARYMSGDADEVRLLKEMKRLGADVDARDEEGDSALMFHACWGYSSRMKVLLELGMDPNLLDGIGRTALHWAADSGSWRSVSLLLAHGATIRRADDPEITCAPPLHLAAAKGSLKAVQALLKHGADPIEQTSEGERPLDAARRGQERLEQLRAESPQGVATSWREGEPFVEIKTGESGTVEYIDDHARVIKLLSRQRSPRG
jgi:uncharacterized protein